MKENDIAKASEAAANSLQERKSSEMKRRICQATLSCLAQVGYENVSTKLIAQTGGMSRGAVNHHYPTRNDILVAAYEHLLAEWERDWPFTQPDENGKLEPSAFIDGLWTGLFAQETYHAILELMLAARKNPDLSERLRSALGPWALKRDIKALSMLKVDKADDTTLKLLQLNLCILRGIAVNQFFTQEDTSEEPLIVLWKDIFDSLLRPKAAKET